MKRFRTLKSEISGILIIARAIRQGQKNRKLDSSEGLNYKFHRSNVIR